MRIGRTGWTTAGLVERELRRLKSLCARPATLAETMVLAAALLVAGTLYCAFYCLIAFPMHHGMMPLSYSAAWAAHSLLPWLAALETWKRIGATAGRIRTALAAAASLVAAVSAAVLLEGMADAALGIANTRSVPLRAAAQLPGLIAAGLLMAWIARNGPRQAAPATTGSIEITVLPPAASIDWVAAAGNYVEFHCGDRTTLARLTMREAERHLDPEAFVRVHRSTIVRRDRIAAVAAAASGADVVLANGRRFRIGQAYRANLRDWLAP